MQHEAVVHALCILSYDAEFKCERQKTQIQIYCCTLSHQETLLHPLTQRSELH